MVHSNHTTVSFRDRYRSSIPRFYNGWAHLTLSSALPLSIVVLLVPTLLTTPATTWLLALPMLVLANLVEYLTHSIPMHKRVPGLSAMVVRHVGVHHRFFRDDSMSGRDHRDFHATLTSPLQQFFIFCGAGVPLWASSYLLVGPHAAAVTASTCALYYVVFEWAHLVCHAPESSVVLHIPGLRAMRHHHLRHHDPTLMAKAGFNITVPFWDFAKKTRPTDVCDG